MGPRSCERGNPRKQRTKNEKTKKLQWGRARASAEIAERQAELRDELAASMGPRSCERGNDTKVVQSNTGNPWGFNGAALVRARKSGIDNPER